MRGIPYVTYLNNILKCIQYYKPMQLNESSSLEDIIGVASDIDDMVFMDKLLKRGNDDIVFIKSYDFLYDKITESYLDIIKNDDIDEELQFEIIENCGDLLNDKIDIDINLTSIGDGNLFEDYSTLDNDFEDNGLKGVLEQSLLVEDDEDAEEALEEVDEEADVLVMGLDDEDDEEDFEESEEETFEYDVPVMGLDDEDDEEENEDFEDYTEEDSDISYLDLDDEDEEVEEDSDISYLDLDDEDEEDSDISYLDLDDEDEEVEEDSDISYLDLDDEDEEVEEDSDISYLDLDDEDEDEFYEGEDEFDMSLDEEDEEDSDLSVMGLDEEDEEVSDLLTMGLDDEDDDEFTMNLDDDEEEFDRPNDNLKKNSEKNRQLENSKDLKLSYGSEKGVVNEKSDTVPKTSDDKLADIIVSASDFILNIPSRLKKTGKVIYNNMKVEDGDV